jgi:hypothetical protein
MQTQVAKNLRGDWAAETVVPYRDNLKLRVVTMKRSSGRLETFVSAITEERGMWTHRMYGDFSALIESETVRVTQRRVGEQHARALTRVDDMIYSADLHYEKITA